MIEVSKEEYLQAMESAGDELSIEETVFEMKRDGDTIRYYVSEG